jgi:hypothetical protein
VGHRCQRASGKYPAHPLSSADHEEGQQSSSAACSDDGFAKRLVSEKHHLPSSLRTLRTTLTVCRVQSRSCHFRAKYSLGRIPVVSATASTGPCGVARAALRKACACSTVSERISPLSCWGILTPSTGFSSNRRHCNACRSADLNTACVYRTVLGDNPRSIIPLGGLNVHRAH